MATTPRSALALPQQAPIPPLPPELHIAVMADDHGGEGTLKLKIGGTTIEIPERKAKRGAGLDVQLPSRIFDIGDSQRSIGYAHSYERCSPKARTTLTNSG